jgi:hypothetical protein
LSGSVVKPAPAPNIEKKYYESERRLVAILRAVAGDSDQQTWIRYNYSRSGSDLVKSSGSTKLDRPTLPEHVHSKVAEE